MLDAYCTSGSSPTVDLNSVVEGHGSIFLLRPLTPAGQSWIDEHIGPDNGYQPYYPTVVIEHRYIADIVATIRNDGLAVC